MQNPARTVVMIALTTLALTVPALSSAAPPPGHPTPEHAGAMLGIAAPAELPFTARVVEAHDSNSYTYVLVEDEDGQRWLAAPRTALTPGTMVRHSDGTLMRNFHSKVLNRTFAGVFFIAAIRAE